MAETWRKGGLEGLLAEKMEGMEMVECGNEEWHEAEPQISGLSDWVTTLCVIVTEEKK